MRLPKLFLQTILLLSISISVAQHQSDLELFIESEELRPSPIAIFVSYKADIKADFGNIIIKDEKKVKRLTFDIDGNKIEESVYRTNGSLNKQERYEHTYDDQRNIIDVSKYTDGIFAGRESYTYNQQGERIEISFYSSEDILTSQEKYTYDNKGSIIEFQKSTFGDSPSKTVSTQFNYDLNGNKTEESDFSGDNLIRQHRFDQKGNSIEFFGYRSDGSLDTHVVKIYDEQGNKIEELNKYFTYGKEVTYKYKYDEQGNTTEYTSYNTDAELVIRQTFSYNQHGNQITQSNYDVNTNFITSQTRCDYEYDKYSNWIKRTCIEFSNTLGKLQANYGLSFKEIIRRDIDYH